MTATATLAPEVTPEQRARAKRAVIASSVGNALEWFDIIVYASFALVISKLFFPTAEGITGLLLTFGTFALSYLIRPLGAIVLGSYGDRAGRKKALTVTIMLMTLGTAMMALAPTAGTIGAWAGLIILFSRLLQGFSAVRRVRHLDGLPHRACPRSQSVLRQLAGRHPGRLHVPRIDLRLRSQHLLVPGLP
jgi:MFS transporter, MHS family, proline/betaine transporter